MDNRVSLLQKIAEKLIGNFEPEAVLQEILQLSVEMFGAASASLSLIDEADPSRLCVRFGVGIDAGRLGVRVRSTDGLIGEVWRTRKPAVIDDYHSWEKRISDPDLDRITTAISAPVLVSDEMIGVLQLAWKDDPVSVNADDLYIFDQLTHLVSAFLGKAMLFRKLQDDKSIIDTMFEGNPGLIYMLDEQGRMVRWNKKLESVSGYSSSEIAHMDCQKFFRGEDIERVSRAIASALRTGSAELEADVYHRDGSHRTFYLTAIPLRMEGKKYVTGNGVDVTRRKELEEEVHLHRDRLEVIVEQRTAELFAANQELTAMNEEMTAINQELQAANCLLESEITLRQEKEKELLLRERQYRAATRLLVSSADQAAERISLILKDALQLVGAPGGYIGFFDEEKNVVVRRYCIGSIDFAAMPPQPMNTGMMSRLFQQGETILVEDYRIYPDRVKDPKLDRIATVIMVPLKRGNQVKGLLAAHWLDEVHTVPQEEIEVLMQYSDLASAFLEKMETHAEIRHLAYHDPLTGMANRTSLNLWLEEELAKARRGEIQGVLFFIDLDELKVVNDTFGHSVGDDMILTAGKHIREAFGNDAFCARIGGDEFIVALAGARDRNEIAGLADQVLGVLCRDYEVFEERVPMSASIGVVMYPEHGETPDEIMKNADSAMYSAKASGRNCWRIYESTLQKDAYETMMLTNSLRRALERDELTLHFQPKLRLADQSIDGFEALMRWNSTEHGPVPPGRFIPLAEKSGVIVAIGEWALREACAFARRLAAEGRKDLHVAVNISPRQLASSDFIDKVRMILAETGIEAGQLEMEVTESILIESMEEGIEKLERLRELGVNVALDDFGTGYSSLTYLRCLPVRTLKVDKSFIDGIIDDSQQAEYVGLIIDLAHALNLWVVAEGVETQLQVERLRQCECDSIQGFVFSRPVPAESAIRLLEK